MDPMRKIIAYYATLRYGDLPAETVQTARALIIDSLACAPLAGASSPP